MNIRLQAVLSLALLALVCGTGVIAAPAPSALENVSPALVCAHANDGVTFISSDAVYRVHNVERIGEYVVADVDAGTERRTVLMDHTATRCAARFVRVDYTASDLADADVPIATARWLHDEQILSRASETLGTFES